MGYFGDKCLDVGVLAILGDNLGGVVRFPGVGHEQRVLFAQPLVQMVQDGKHRLSSQALRIDKLHLAVVERKKT